MAGRDGVPAHGGPDDADPVGDLLATARRAYGDDRSALAEILRLERRRHEPVRIALAGMVKAGKSTLVNALIGEQIAPTDAGECTRIVTVYRYRRTPRVALQLTGGGERTLPLQRDGGRLVLDLRGTPPESVARIMVDWPAQALTTMTLIDTPGTASASTEVSQRTLDSLLTADGAPDSDGVVYLMRHLHAADVAFLEELRASGLRQGGLRAAVAVLSRADEVGGGRLDSMMSARRIAERYRTEGDLDRLALGVVPVAGLIAQSARTLRESEFRALQRLAAVDRSTRDRMLVSAARFGSGSVDVGIDETMRMRLLDRFGLYGLRLCAVLLSSGELDSSTLADVLLAQSGLEELKRVIEDQFAGRAPQLKQRSVALAIARLVRRHPTGQDEEMLARVERVLSGATVVTELEQIDLLRRRPDDLSADELEEARRLLGAEGVEHRTRLALADSATDSEVRAVALDTAARWRAWSEQAHADRRARQLSGAVLRSCEAIVAAVPSSALRPVLRLVTDPEPRPGARQQGEQESHSR